MNDLIKNLKNASEKLARGESGEMQKKTNIPGIILFITAAFFSISLLCGSLGGGIFWRFGKMLIEAYGVCSMLIPLFFFAAGIQMIGEKWRLKSGAILICAVVPFFTLVGAEKIIRYASKESSGGVLIFEIVGTLILSAVIVFGELFLISIFGEFVQKRFSPGWYGKKSGFDKKSRDKNAVNEETEEEEIDDEDEEEKIEDGEDEEESEEDDFDISENVYEDFASNEEIEQQEEKPTFLRKKEEKTILSDIFENPKSEKNQETLMFSYEKPTFFGDNAQTEIKEDGASEDDDFEEEVDSSESSEGDTVSEDVYEETAENDSAEESEIDFEEIDENLRDNIASAVAYSNYSKILREKEKEKVEPAEEQPADVKEEQEKTEEIDENAFRPESPVEKRAREVAKEMRQKSAKPAATAQPQDYANQQYSDYEQAQNSANQQYSDYQAQDFANQQYSDYEQAQNSANQQYSDYQAQDFENPQYSDYEQSQDFANQQYSDYEQAQNSANQRYSDYEQAQNSANQQYSDYEQSQDSANQQYSDYEKSQDYENQRYSDYEQAQDYTNQQYSDYEQAQNSANQQYSDYQAQDFENQQYSDYEQAQNSANQRYSDYEQAQNSANQQYSDYEQSQDSANQQYSDYEKSQDYENQRYSDYEQAQDYTNQQYSDYEQSQDSANQQYSDYQAQDYANQRYSDYQQSQDYANPQYSDYEQAQNSANQQYSNYEQSQDYANQQYSDYQQSQDSANQQYSDYQQSQNSANQQYSNYEQSQDYANQQYSDYEQAQDFANQQYSDYEQAQNYKNQQYSDYQAQNPANQQYSDYEQSQNSANQQYSDYQPQDSTNQQYSDYEQSQNYKNQQYSDYEQSQDYANQRYSDYGQAQNYAQNQRYSDYEQSQNYAQNQQYSDYQAQNFANPQYSDYEQAQNSANQRYSDYEQSQDYAQNQQYSDYQQAQNYAQNQQYSDYPKSQNYAQNQYSDYQQAQDFSQNQYSDYQQAQNSANQRYSDYEQSQNYAQNPQYSDYSQYQEESSGNPKAFRPVSPVELRARAVAKEVRKNYRPEPLVLKTTKKNTSNGFPLSAWIPEFPREVRTDLLNVQQIFSSMDSDAAQNPVFPESDSPKNNFQFEKAQNQEKPKANSEIPQKIPSENAQNENSEKPSRILQNQNVPLQNTQKIEQKMPIPKDLNTEQKPPMQFDPVAKPIVDSNGIEFDYPQNQDDDFDEDDFDEDFDDDDSLPKTDPFKSANNAPPPQTFRKGPYIVPADLLDTYPNNNYWEIDEETRRGGDMLKSTLAEFKIEAEVTGIRKGPAVTMYEILPAPGVKLSKIVALQDNIALRLAAASVRIVAPIPGKHAVGIEVPNKNRAIVSFREIIERENPAFDKMAIPVVLGKDISGEMQFLDLAKTPHLLIAGSTGAGKSVCVNTMLLSILFKRSPDEVKLVLVDPKIVELKLYNDIPHLLAPVITEPKRALQALQYCLCEMERRYALLDGMGVRNIISYNKKIIEKRIATEKLPYIVVIIDEFADLMATTGKELEQTIARLAAMSRAVGIHLVLATQRPSVDVITGLIKANIPSRIAFMVASKMDSRIIIDGVGAEKLLGKGDMLYVGVTDPFPRRIQGTLVSDDEVERVVNFVKTFGEPDYIDEEMFVDDEEEEPSGNDFGGGGDELYDQALQIVLQSGKASASYIQRRLKIGYNRAARLVEEMEARGIVGPANGSKPREIIHIP